MGDSFDPYHKWLGIPPKDQPPNHYRLLALELFENDADVIESAADQRMAHVRTFQTGQNSAISQRILNELSAAKLCLLDRKKKAEYDGQLRQKIEDAKPPGLPSALAPQAEPRSLPVARPLPSKAAAPVFITDAGLSSGAKRTRRKKGFLQRPAVLAAGGVVIVLLAVAAYWVVVRGPEATVAVTADAGPAKPPATPLAPVESSPKRSVNAASTPVPAIRRPDATPGASKPDFEIIKATWGTGDKWVDVTDGVRRQVKDNRLLLMVWSNKFGSPEDPALGVGKNLRIEYRARGKRYTVDYPDFFFVYLDGNPLAPPTDSPDGLELLEARYGAGETYVDVLPQARLHLRDGRFSVPADQFAPTTDAELANAEINSGTFKVLWIRYRNGTGEHFTYAWNADPVVIDSHPLETAGPPVDLLKLIDVQRDVVDGEWSLTDGVLQAPGTRSARIQLPVDAPEEYALGVIAESEPQIMDISVLLPVGGKQVMGVIDGFGGVTTGLHLVNGMLAHSNPSYPWRCARLFEQGRPNALVYVVRHNRVRILRDGAEILRWSGNPEGFSLADDWKVPNTRRIALAAYDTPYRVSKLELVPLAPEKSPFLAGLPTGKTVEVLKSIDLDRDLMHGNWQYDGHALFSPDSDKGRLQIPAVVPADYRLDVVAQRESGKDCLSFTLPVAGKQVSLLLDGQEGKRSGLQTIDDKTIDANETRYEGTIFGDGKPKAISVTVHKNRVRVHCDGQQIVDWTGDVNRLKPTDDAPYNDRIYLGDWYSRYRLTKISLTPLGSEDEPDSPPPSALAGAAVDVLKQIDVKRDAQWGEWRMEEGALLAPATAAARLQVPVVPPDEYKITLVAKGEPITRDIVFGLPIAGHQVLLILDGWTGTPSALQLVDGKPGTDNETTVNHRVLADGKTEIVCAVGKRGIDVRCNGESVIHWTGDPSRLSSDRDVPDPKHIYLNSWSTPLRITRFVIEPLAADEVTRSTPLSEPKSQEFAPPARTPVGNGSRSPIPNDNALKKARQELQKELGSKISAAKSPQQKRKLAEELAQQAAAADKADAHLYALLNQTIDLAESAGDLDLAWQAADQLAKAFDVDAVALRLQSLSELAKGSKSPEQSRELAEAACRLMASALAAEQPAVVKKAAAQAQGMARRTKDEVLIDVIAARTHDAGKLAGDFDAVAAARGMLKTMPDDSLANRTVGCYELCAAGNWDGALPKLSKSADADWKGLAAQELQLARSPATLQQQLAAADAWSSRAEQEPWPGRHYLQMRAARWYGRALPSLTGDQRDRVTARLKSLLARDEGLPAWELFATQDASLEGEAVRLNRRGKVETLVDYGGPIDVSFVARTDGLNIRLYAHGHESVIWNWEVNKSELRVARPDGHVVGSPVKPLEPNRWYAFRYLLTPQSITIFVDGTPIFAENHTSAAFGRSPVRVFSADDSVVDVRRLVVKSVE